jgi:hypothetical protein
MARALATASRCLALDAGAARAHATDIEIATDIDTEASVDLTVGQGLRSPHEYPVVLGPSRAIFRPKRNVHDAVFSSGYQA